MSFVAVIDDDEQLRTAVADLIASYGIESRSFASSKQYLDSGVLARTDCIVTDVQMSEMNGLELHKTLLRRGYRMPVIFITAFFDEQIQREAEALGALRLLRKPFQAVALMTCINDALARGRSPGD